MSAKRADSLPVELRVLLKDITEAISAISRGDDPEKQMESLYRATDGAVRTASSMAPHPPLTWGTPLPARFGDIIGDNIRALRVEAGWSQEQLANAMATAGFSWKRLTVTEVEGASRRLGLEELLAIAALFAVPAIELMLPNDYTALDMPHGTIYSAALLELLLGSGGKLGQGGVDWRAPVLALGGEPTAKDFRPASDLWRKRRSSSVGAAAARRSPKECS